MNAVARFLNEHSQYLRWAVTLADAPNAKMVGAVCLVRDGMAYHGVPGFSLRAAHALIRAAQGVSKAKEAFEAAQRA